MKKKKGAAILTETKGRGAEGLNMSAMELQKHSQATSTRRGEEKLASQEERRGQIKHSI